MTKSIKVYRPTTEVFVGSKGDRSIKAEIIATIIKPEYVVYEVAWWEGTSRKTACFSAAELSIKRTTGKTKVGFRN